jgi:predicted metal-dependent hydrolase
MNLDYRIVYSQRKTITLVVERDRSVVVRAPVGTPEEQIHQVVEAKKLWLFEKINHPQKYSALRVRKEFVAGETVPYLGRNYRLEIIPGDLPGIYFDAGFKISRFNHEEAAQLFQKWYTERAYERIPARAKNYAASLGVQPNRVLISDLKVSWGTCTPKDNLNFNWRIMKAPPFVIDYLIVHELAHLLEPNHTPRFWNIVAVQSPKYEQAKEWLLKNGDMLETDF